MSNRRYSEQEQAEWRERKYGFDLDDLETVHWLWWDELDTALRYRVVAYLREVLPRPLLEEVRVKRIRYGNEWMEHMFEDQWKDNLIPYTFHYGAGMFIRNLLRNVVLDKELPSGNWDDFYVAALLSAAHFPFDQEKE